MRKFLLYLAIPLAFLLGAWSAYRFGPALLDRWGGKDAGMGMDMQEPETEAGKEVLYWKSSMVPGEVHQEAGKDSMGMPLVPVYKGDNVGPGVIQIDPATQQNMGVRIGEVESGALVKTVRTVGFVDYDETALAVVSTKIGGWIEKLYVDETGVHVHTGDPLFEIYSPTLFSAQQEYLVALESLQKEDVSIVPRSRMDSEGLLKDARTRLEYFDVPEETIDELERTRKVKKLMTLRAPFSGIVTHKNIVEGQKVEAGADLLRIADLSRVWVIGRVYEYDLPYVSVGQEARMTLSYLPGKTFRGKVTYLYPYLERGTREVSVRMEFPNPGYELKPGMYATIQFRTEIEPKATLVQDMAIIDTGQRSVAFIAKGEGHFELRDVVTGIRSEDNRIQILSGLVPGDRVVLSGQFLLDSESRLREAALKFLEIPQSGAEDEPTSEAKGESQMDETKAAPEKAPEKAPDTSSFSKPMYVCPMPEHQSILYEEPGDCPLCGKPMELVPVQRPGATTETEGGERK